MFCTTVEENECKKKFLKLNRTGFQNWKLEDNSPSLGSILKPSLPWGKSLSFGDRDSSRQCFGLSQLEGHHVGSGHT